MRDDNITILIKLFDTLKESSNRNEESTQKLIMQQLELVGQIKNLPVEDLRQALKEHARDSADDIDGCSGMIELKTADIMDVLRIILNKINKISIIVIVVLSVLSASWVIIKTLNTRSEDQVYEQIKEKITNEQLEMIQDIRTQIQQHIKEELPSDTNED